MESRRYQKRILLVDDHPIVLKGLIDSLKQKPKYYICGTQMKKNCIIQSTSELKPDIIILDLMLEDSCTLDLIDELKAMNKPPLILIYSIHENILYIERALKSGADGYIIKNEPVETLYAALEEIETGKRYIKQDIQDKLLEKYLSRKSDSRESMIQELSNREYEIFRNIGQGYGMDEIAETMKLSIKTIHNYRERIKAKLKIGSARELYQFAIQWNRNFADY